MYQKISLLIPHIIFPIDFWVKYCSIQSVSYKIRKLRTKIYLLFYFKSISRTIISIFQEYSLLVASHNQVQLEEISNIFYRAIQSLHTYLQLYAYIISYLHVFSAQGDFFLVTAPTSPYGLKEKGLIPDDNQTRRRRSSTLTRLLKYLR